MTTSPALAPQPEPDAPKVVSPAETPSKASPAEIPVQAVSTEEPAKSSEPRKPLVLVSSSASGAASPKPNPKADDYVAATEALQTTLKAFKPVDVRTLAPVIQRTLVWMRAQSDAAIQKDRSIAPSAEMGHDLRLLRFLIGQKWDPVEAAKEYVKALQERKKLGVDRTLRDAMVAANADFFAGRADMLSKFHFHPAAEASARLMPRIMLDPRGDGPYPLLRDKQGHLVVCEHAPDFERVAQLGADNYQATELAFTELQMLVLDELSYRDGILRMACRVQDTLKQESALAKSLMPNPFAGSGETGFKKTGALMKSLYPTVVFKWYMVNLDNSYKSHVQGAIKNFGGRSGYKMIVCGMDFQEAILKQIGRSELPEELGGTLPNSLFTKPK